MITVRLAQADAGRTESCVDTEEGGTALHSAATRCFVPSKAIFFTQEDLPVSI
jgi:hypothetical protein